MQRKTIAVRPGSFTRFRDEAPSQVASGATNRFDGGVENAQALRTVAADRNHFALAPSLRGISNALLALMKGEKLLDAILELSPLVRYAALHLGGGEPLLRERTGTAEANASEGERWEELVVNPVLVELAARRGDVDCGGLDYLVVRYHRFFNLVLPLDGGHLSVLVDPDADPLPLIGPIREISRAHGAAARPKI